MSPSTILHHTTKSIFVAYSERELTFEVNLPTNLGELTFKNTSKWVRDSRGAGKALVLWCFYLNPHCRPRYECSYPTRGVITENYN